MKFTPKSIEQKYFDEINKYNCTIYTNTYVEIHNKENIDR